MYKTFQWHIQKSQVLFQFREEENVLLIFMSMEHSDVNKW